MIQQGDKIKIEGINFKVYKEIGSGGTATCYIMRKSMQNRKMTLVPDQFVLKVLNGDDCRLEGRKNILKREYEIGHRLNCPFIAHYLSFLDDYNACAIELVKGMTLEKFLERDREKTVERAYFGNSNLGYYHTYECCMQLLKGIKEMHSHRIYHCDIKPLNIMMMKNTWQAVIIDLGMAISDGDFNMIGTTDEWQAPEMKNGQADNRSDIYMLGRVMKLICAHQPIFDSIIEVCMMESKDERYQTIDDVIKAFQSIYFKDLDSQILGMLTNEAENLTIKEDRLYEGSKFVCMTKDATLFRNNKQYMKLLMKRQKLEASYQRAHKRRLKTELMKDEKAENETKSAWNACYVETTNFEQNMIQLVAFIKDHREMMTDQVKLKVIKLMSQNKLKEAKACLHIDELSNHVNDLVANIKELKRQMKRNLDLLLLYARLSIVDLSDSNRISTTLTTLEKMLDASEELPLSDRNYYYNQYGNMLVYNRIITPEVLQSLEARIKKLSNEPYPSETLIHLLFDLAEINKISNKKQEAYDVLNIAIDCIGTLQGDHNKILKNRLYAEAYYYKGRNDYYFKKFNQAGASANESLKYSTELSKLLLADVHQDMSMAFHLMCDALNLKGNAYGKNNDFYNAIKYYQQVIDMNEKYKDSLDHELYISNLGEQYYWIGDANINRGKIDEGRTLLRKSIEYLSKAGKYHTQDIRTLAKAWNTLGVSLINARDNTESKSCFDKVESLIKEYATINASDTWINDMRSQLNESRSLLDFGELLNSL